MALDDNLKALINKLQIPLTKLALIDETFLIDTDHHARQLLNAITQSAQGYKYSQKEKQLDPLYNKLNDIVSTLLTNFENDTSIFSNVLSEFNDFDKKEKRRSKILEKRTLDAEDGKAKAEVARMIIGVEVELRLIDIKLPKVVLIIVEKAWRNYLFITALKHGYESLAWHDALATLDELILSVQPLKTDSQRSNLIHLASDLTKKLQEGFESISYNPYEGSKIFKVLEHTHLKLIRGKEVERFEIASSTSIKRFNTLKVKKALKNIESSDDHISAKKEHNKADVDIEPLDTASKKMNNSALKEKNVGQNNIDADLYDDLTDKELNAIDGFSQGSWFEMQINENIFSRCRLAAFIKPTGKYIFINRSGMKVAEKTKFELALALKDNKLKELDNSLLFDRALEAVVSSMQKQKKING